ncbi:F-box protein PP2-B11-like [Macadamia integrifolia]|uniref:F-box protein PP2-B11-like n=1 Tax=Macadamia integrifolia TaxID=60698 RepID=UPI001C4F9B90|nr:F-box protein PP2-B11-like [Macadamia integrifolia]
MGELFNERGEDGELEMSLQEVPSGHWKSSLIIQVQPTNIQGKPFFYFPLRKKKNLLSEDTRERSRQTAISKKKKEGEMEQGSAFDLYLLPEDCISNILSLTTPRDVCRSSTVSPVFRSAANSDSVWEKFLPSDIHQILSSSSVSPSLPTFSSKKQLFLHLCDNPLLIDGGTKTFALEKCSGKKCYMIGARELTIIWGSSPEYWKWIPHPESRFSEVAELLCVWWLEIRGKIETRLLSPNTTYGAYLVLKFTNRAYGFEPLAEVSVKLASGTGGAEEGEVKSVSLNPRSLRSRNASSSEEAVADPPPEGPKERGDGWMEIEMGEFFNERGEDGEVVMSLMEVNCSICKSGLIIQGIELRPKENQPV